MATYSERFEVTSDQTFTSEDLFTGSNFSTGDGAVRGGVLAVIGCTVTVDGSTFTNNTNQSTPGGAVWGSTGAMTVTGAYFEGNTAAASVGGAIYHPTSHTVGAPFVLTVDSSTFTNNFAQGTENQWGGGAIYSDAHAGNPISTIISNSTFTNNFANTGAGGAIHAWGGAALSNNYFEGNTTNKWGGAVSFNMSVTDTGSTYTHNLAADGGAVHMQNAGGWSHGTGTFTNVLVTANTATGSGGAFRVDGGAYLTLIGSTVTNNIGSSAISISGFATITNTLVDHNIIDHGEPGGIYVNNSGHAEITGSTVSNNVGCLWGGGMYVGVINGTTSVVVTDTDFIGNTATNGGGGITVWCATATISGGTIARNVAGLTSTNEPYGGGMNLRRSTASVNGGYWTGNIAQRGGAMNLWDWGELNVTGTTITGNTATVFGGGISNHGASSFVTITDAIVTNNTALGETLENGSRNGGHGGGLYSEGQTSIIGGTFARNFTQSNGGAIQVQSNTTTINGTLIDSNTAAYGVVGADKGGGYGGGICVMSTAFIDNATITNNYGDSQYGGSGVHISTNGFATVGNTLIAGNTAGWTGGGLASVWGSWRIIGSTVADNYAKNYGGGVSKWAASSANSTASIIDSTFTGNISGSLGGGVFGKNFIVTDSVFDGNTAGQGAGIYSHVHEWATAGFLTVSGSTFTNNYASVVGGGIMADGSNKQTDAETGEVNWNICNSVNVTDSVFRGNTAGSEGGALFYSNNDSHVIFSTVTNSLFDGNVALHDTYGGGAIYNNSANAFVTINDSTFTNNVAAGAGGAITTLRGVTEINNAVFEGNTSDGQGYSGGAISEFGAGTVSVSNSTFSHNVGKIAGAIDATSVNAPSHVIVKDSLFTGNTAAIGAIKTRGAYNYLENVTFETITDSVNIEGAKSITLKGDIVANGSISLSGCDIAADGLNITFGYTGGVTAAWFGNEFVTAEGAATGLESITFANIGNVYFDSANGQDLTGIDVTIITDVYDAAGTYNVASGISGIDAGVNIMKGLTLTTTPFDTPYVLDDTTLVQKVNFGGSVLTVTTADTLYIGVDAADANGFDMFETRNDLEAVYGQDFTGTVISYEPQEYAFVNEAWTAQTTPASITVNEETYSLTWGSNAFNNTDNAKRFLANDGALYIVDGLRAASYITGDISTYFVGGDLSNLDIRAVAAGGTASAMTIGLDGITSSKELYFMGDQGEATVEGNALLLVKDAVLSSQYQRFISGNVAGNYTVGILGSTLNTPYVAGWAQVAGTINAVVQASTINGHLALTAQAAEVTIASGVNISVEDSSITGQLRGTGSANCLINGDVVIDINNTTVADAIYGSYGNRVAGNVAISMSDTSAKTVIAEKTAGKVTGAKGLSITGGTNTIAEGISGFDTLAIYTGAELNLTQAGLISDTIISNNGQLNASLTNSKWTYKTLTALNSVDSFTGVNLTINGTAVAEGSFLNDGYQEVTVADGSISIVALASRVGGNYTMDSLVTQSRTNYIKFNAGVDGTMSAQTLDRDLKFEGNGVAATAVTAGALYAAGNSLALKDLTWTGSIYGGVKDDEVASVELDLDNVKLTKDLYGAGVAAQSALDVTGDVVATLKDVTGDKSYYGAGYANGGDITVDGSVKTTINGGSYKTIYSGANLSANATGKSYTLGAAELTIEDGVFSGIVGNGGFVRAGQTSTQGHSVLNISGGTFNAAVYGGAFAYGTGSKTTAISAGTATVTGGIDVTITGGVFNGDIYGGSLASNSHIASANTSVSGEIYVTLDASQNDIYINGNVIAGSLGKGAINGNTIVYVFGDGDKLHFASDSWVTGTSEYGNSVNGYVSGIKVLAFNEFTGSFTANVGNGAFDRVTVALDSDVAITNAEFDQVSQWSLYIDSCISGNLSANALDLSGDTINVNTIEAPLGDAEVTLLNSATGLTWDSNTAVNILGETAAATATDGVWESDNYRLTATAAGTLTVGKLLV